MTAGWPAAIAREAGWAAAALAVAGAGAVAAVGASFRTALQSDDVAQLVAVHSWREDGPSRFYAGSDTLLLRSPLTWLVDVLTEPGRGQLMLLTGLLCGLAGLALVAGVRWQAGRSGRVGAAGVAGCLAAFWVVTNPGVAEANGRPLVRNVELGLAVLGLIGLERLIEWKPRRALPVLTVLSVALGVFLWNDPYLTFLVALPAAAVCLVSAATARSAWRAAVGASVLAGVAVSKALELVVGHIGLELVKAPIRLLDDTEIEDARRLALDQAPMAFGVSRRPASGVDDLAAWGNRVAVVVLLAGAAVAAVAVLRRWRTPPVAAAAGVLIVPLPLLAWVVSSNVLVGYSWRYLALTPFVLAMLVPFALSSLRGRARHAAVVVVAASLVFASVGNVRLALRSVTCGERCPNPQYVEGITRTQPLPATLRPSGVRKLFAPYWQANLVTYLAGGDIPAVAVTCESERIVARRWLTTEKIYSAPAPVSHLLLEDGTLDGCAFSIVERQLGPPLRVERVSPRFELAAYPGDLVLRLPSVTR